MGRNWLFFGWETVDYNNRLNGTYLRGVIQDNFVLTSIESLMDILGVFYYHRLEEKVSHSKIHSIIGEYHQAARFLEIIQF